MGTSFGVLWIALIDKSLSALYKKRTKHVGPVQKSWRWWRQGVRAEQEIAPDLMPSSDVQLDKGSLIAFRQEARWVAADR
jgi:hypothetical protein